MDEEEPHVRARRWIDDLPTLQRQLRQASHVLSIREYALALRSFFRQLMKQPEERVRTVEHVQVPVDDAEEGMTLGEMIDYPERLFRALDLIVKYDGDLQAAAMDGMHV